MTGFNLNNTIDGTKSIKINYLPIGLNNITFDSTNKKIVATCELSSTSNATFTDNNVTTEYKAKQIYIVGKANDTKINMINGIESDGQLIIKNVNANGDKILYMCFPLIVTNPGPISGGIDAVIQTATSGTSDSTLTVDFQSDIFATEVPQLKYIHYTSNKGNSANVVTFGSPVKIISVYLKTLENNTNLFNIQPAVYSILAPPTPGEWMECDYVPIDSAEVESQSFELPIQSGIVQQASAQDSLKTMFMYILFLLFTGLSYTIIPISYKYALKLLFDLNGDVQKPGRVKTMGRFDLITRIVLIILIVTFFVIGEQYLLYGIIITIITLLGYIIISSKKSMAGNHWPIEELERERS
jgi:hypothetical protein